MPNKSETSKYEEEILSPQNFNDFVNQLTKSINGNCIITPEDKCNRIRSAIISSQGKVIRIDHTPSRTGNIQFYQGEPLDNRSKTCLSLFLFGIISDTGGSKEEILNLFSHILTRCETQLEEKRYFLSYLEQEGESHILILLDRILSGDISLEILTTQVNELIEDSPKIIDLITKSID